MTLEKWAANGWLRPHQTSPEEIQDLLAIVKRDLTDAGSDISADWKFGIAYNAALKLCTILLYASGFKAEKTLQHYRTLHTMPLILGPERKTDADYLETCRIKRNTVEYDYAGAVTRNDAQELVSFTKELRSSVIHWLETEHIELLGPGAG